MPTSAGLIANGRIRSVRTRMREGVPRPSNTAMPNARPIVISTDRTVKITVTQRELCNAESDIARVKLSNR